MGYSIKVTEHAHNDLDQIVSYIVGELGNPSAALTLLTAVERVYEKLAETPNMYGLCRKPLLSRQGYRKAPIEGYLMIYKVDEAAGSVYVERCFIHLEEYGKSI